MYVWLYNYILYVCIACYYDIHTHDIHEKRDVKKEMLIFQFYFCYLTVNLSGPLDLLNII